MTLLNIMCQFDRGLTSVWMLAFVSPQRHNDRRSLVFQNPYQWRHFQKVYFVFDEHCTLCPIPLHKQKHMLLNWQRKLKYAWIITEKRNINILLNFVVYELNPQSIHGLFGGATQSGKNLFWFVYFYTSVYFKTIIEESSYWSGQDLGRNIPKFINCWKICSELVSQPKVKLTDF